MNSSLELLTLVLVVLVAANLLMWLAIHQHLVRSDRTTDQIRVQLAELRRQLRELQAGPPVAPHASGESHSPLTPLGVSMLGERVHEEHCGLHDDLHKGPCRTLEELEQALVLIRRSSSTLVNGNGEFEGLDGPPDNPDDPDDGDRRSAYPQEDNEKEGAMDNRPYYRRAENSSFGARGDDQWDAE